MDNRARIIIVGATRVRAEGSKFPIPQWAQIYHPDGIAPTLTATSYKEPIKIMTTDNPPSDPAILRMERTDQEKLRRAAHGDNGAKFSAAKQFEPRPDGITNTLTSNTKDNMLIEPKAIGYTRDDNDGATYPAVMSHPLSHAHEHPKPHTDASPSLRATDYKCPQCVIEQSPNPSTERIIQVGNVVPEHPKFKNRIQGRVYAPEGLSATLNTHIEPKIAMPLYRIRKLTPRECWRLMDVDDADYDKIDVATDHKGRPLISKTQRYKLAGNSIVVSCLYHIFHKMFIDTAPDQPRQLTIFDIPGVD